MAKGIEREIYMKKKGANQINICMEKEVLFSTKFEWYGIFGPVREKKPL